jgi:hypothetical protein
MAEEVRKEMFEGGNLPNDPLDFYLRWYNATNVPLSKMIRTILEDESFLGDSRRFLENYATLEQVFQRASEEYFGYLQLATRSDNTRVAELVVGLDAKVDRMEEAFEEFEHGYATPATAEAVEALEGRVKDPGAQARRQPVRSAADGRQAGSATRGPGHLGQRWPSDDRLAGGDRGNRRRPS